MASDGKQDSVLTGIGYGFTILVYECILNMVFTGILKNGSIEDAGLLKTWKYQITGIRRTEHGKNQPIRRRMEINEPFMAESAQNNHPAHKGTGAGNRMNVIITMLKRLEAKGAVRHEEGERAKLFYPSVERDGAVLEETRGFLNRVYQGSLSLMVNAMVSSSELSDEEIEDLKAILDKAEEGRHG